MRAQQLRANARLTCAFQHCRRRAISRRHLHGFSSSLAALMPPFLALRAYAAAFVRTWLCWPSRSVRDQQVNTICTQHGHQTSTGQRPAASRPFRSISFQLVSAVLGASCSPLKKLQVRLYFTQIRGRGAARRTLLCCSSTGAAAQTTVVAR